MTAQISSNNLGFRQRFRISFWSIYQYSKLLRATGAFLRGALSLQVECCAECLAYRARQKYAILSILHYIFGVLVFFCFFFFHSEQKHLTSHPTLACYLILDFDPSFSQPNKSQLPT